MLSFATVNRRTIFTWVCGLMAGAVMTVPAIAAPNILTVCGAIDGANGGCRSFTQQQLEQLPQTSITTTTPWNKQPVTYRGIAVETLLSTLKAKGSQLRLLALNDYAVTADAKQLTDNGAILAVTRDGQPMPISDKGPLWVMFPFDANPKLRADNIYTLSVWQLSRIDVQ